MPGLLSLCKPQLFPQNPCLTQLMLVSHAARRKTPSHIERKQMEYLILAQNVCLEGRAAPPLWFQSHQVELDGGELCLAGGKKDPGFRLVNSSSARGIKQDRSDLNRNISLSSAQICGYRCSGLHSTTALL